MPIILNGTGTISGLTAGGLPNSVITRPNMGYAGAILQVVSAVKSDTFTTTSTSFTDITGLTASITPSSATSKILVLVNLGVYCPTSSVYSAAFRISRSGTAVGIGDAASTRSRASFKITHVDANHGNAGGFSFLDSPASTSALSYTLQMQMQSGSTGCINRSGNDNDTSDAYAARTASTITLMEVAG